MLLAVLHVLHLRAAYFVENNLAAISMIQETGILGHALLPDLKLPMIATADVGDYVAQRLLDLDFSGKQTRELLGQRDLSMAECATIIGRGIGKPDLRYEQFSYGQVQQVLEQMGMSSKKAAVYIEMFMAINTGVLAAQELRSRENTTPTRLNNLCGTSLRLHITGRLASRRPKRLGATKELDDYHQSPTLWTASRLIESFFVADWLYGDYCLSRRSRAGRSNLWRFLQTGGMQAQWPAVSTPYSLDSEKFSTG